MLVRLKRCVQSREIDDEVEMGVDEGWGENKWRDIGEDRSEEVSGEVEEMK